MLARPEVREHRRVEKKKLAGLAPYGTASAMLGCEQGRAQGGSRHLSGELGGEQYETDADPVPKCNPIRPHDRRVPAPGSELIFPRRFKSVCQSLCLIAGREGKHIVRIEYHRLGTLQQRVHPVVGDDLVNVQGPREPSGLRETW